jgi:hypothetical protein
MLPLSNAFILHNNNTQLSLQVDSMLGSYMEDIGITPEQFEKACSKNSAGGLQIRFHQVGALTSIFWSHFSKKLSTLLIALFSKS